MSMLSDEIQLGYALEAFQWAYKLGPGWSTKHLIYFKTAGIASMSDLQMGCRENTVNIDMELFGIPVDEQLSTTIIQCLSTFLPGPHGLRCFRLAQMAARKVQRGNAETDYVHRLENGKVGEETWKVPVDEPWILRVDCAGFVRNCLKHVTKNPFKMSLSDRDFMRAKDFFGFFEIVPYTVMDREDIPDGGNTYMKWRRVVDLRMVIPGDVIVYRPRGNAAGGAAFTTNDRKDLRQLLKAVKAAQLWREEPRSLDNLVARNFAKDVRVQPWVKAVRNKLNAVGIGTVKELRKKYNQINDLVVANNYVPLSQDTLALIKECSETTAMNTGHIVFAAGPAVQVDDDVFRVRVVHSTKHGKKDENGEVLVGVQEYFKRFKMIRKSNGEVTFTREMKHSKAVAACVQNFESGAVTDDEDDPMDDMEDKDADEEDDVAAEEEEEEAVGDDLTGQSDVQVLAARMGF